TLTSAFLCIRAVLPGMIERGGGTIVNVASVNRLGYYGNAAYSAAKAGLINLTLSVAARYGRHGVRSNSVAPGSIRTGAWDERLARQPDLIERLARRCAHGRRCRSDGGARALVCAGAHRNAGRGGVRRAVPGLGRGLVRERRRPHGRRR